LTSVAFVVDSIPIFAGVQRYVLNSCIGLRNTGFQPYVVLRKNDKFTEHLRANQIEYFEYCGNILHPLNLIRIALFSRSRKIKIVHSNMGMSAIAVALLKPFIAAKKHVFTQHFVHPASSQSSALKRCVAKVLFMWVYGSHDNVIAVSEEVKKAIIDRKEVSRKKVEMIWNGIPANQKTKRFLEANGSITYMINKEQKIIEKVVKTNNAVKNQVSKIKKSKPVLLMVSRLEPDKNVHEVIDIMDSIKREGYDFKFFLIGAGSLEQAIKDKVNEYGLMEHVFITGQVKDVEAYYQQADILVHPVFNEAFGFVLVEAMSYRLPVIAINSGGPKDIVVNNETGFLVEDMQELKSKIKQMLINMDSVSIMGERSYSRYIEQFTLERMSARMSEVYLGK